MPLLFFIAVTVASGLVLRMLALMVLDILRTAWKGTK